MKRLRVYIAGPYAKGNVRDNVNEAIRYGELVSQKGHIPFIPHLYHLWHSLYQHEQEFWCRQDLYWLDKCDLLIRIPGESIGADNEIEYAKTMGIRVIHNLDDLEELPW